MLEHGGRLRAAAQRYDIPIDRWLDLSTGINPNGWPIPSTQTIPRELWTRLPEADDALIPAARHYYAVPHILPVAGSQAAIQALPSLCSVARIGMLPIAYAEHAQAWQKHGHQIIEWCGPATLAHIDHLLLIHPNNPSAANYPVSDLLNWHAQLALRGGWLIVDEAFIDPHPQASLATYCTRPGLIVLRSLGKFFGLAGARVGFVIAEKNLLQTLENNLGPWPISGPSRWLASQALLDHEWQATARVQLKTASTRLANLLDTQALPASAGCALFQWVCTEKAEQIAQYLAQRAILVRQFKATATHPASLRFGLPATEEQWTRLNQALSEYKQTYA